MSDKPETRFDLLETMLIIVMAIIIAPGVVWWAFKVGEWLG